MPVSLKRLKFIAAEWSRLDPCVRSWDSLTEAERLKVLDFTTLEPEELPLAVLPDGPNPLMLSNYRLVWRSGKQTTELDLNRISAIGPPRNHKYDKLRLHTLIIKTHDSKEHSVEVPPGETCFCIWNLILRFKGHGFRGR